MKFWLTSTANSSSDKLLDAYLGLDTEFAIEEFEHTWGFQKYKCLSIALGNLKELTSLSLFVDAELVLKVELREFDPQLPKIEIYDDYRE